MKQYYTTTITFSEMQENGTMKKTRESYLVDAMSFSEAEARTIEYATLFRNEFAVVAIKPTNYSDIIANNGESGSFYRAKVYFITIDEKTARERKTASYMLVEATTPEGAISNINNAMKGSITDYTVDTIALTNITEVLKYDKESV